MLKIEKVVTPSPEQWEIVIEGARNPLNSWDQMDSCACIHSCDDCSNFSICNTNYEPYFRRFWEEGSGVKDYAIGPKDMDLLMRLAKAGTDESKYRRMLPVYITLTAPLYWWKEFDTYKVGTVRNSCSTMHKIHAKEFEVWDFSFGKLIGKTDFCWENDIMAGPESRSTPLDILEETIHALNVYREKFLECDRKLKSPEGLTVEERKEMVELKKKYWWQMIQLLPSSYNQKATVEVNYEVLANIYRARRNHKLDEWHVFCDHIETLPYSELILCTAGGK